MLTVVALALLITVYVAVMNQLVDVVKVQSDGDANRRDLLYVYVHAGLLLTATLAGFLLGKWFSGLGLAFATLFLIVLAIGMLAVQMSSYELACRGHNDIVRHWQC